MNWYHNSYSEEAEDEMRADAENRVQAMQERAKLINQMFSPPEELREEAEKAFEASGGKPKIAVLMVILGIGREEAEALVAAHDGHLSLAIEAFRSGDRSGDRA